ncbi:MAG: hypothetical protein JNL50_11160 [Phycisphaerae bacterium]|nr:hypothetical protein [Phycisphaerae bacterium]
MRKAIIYWILAAVALLVAGPIAGTLVGGVRTDAGTMPTLIAAGVAPVSAWGAALGAVGLAAVVGVVGALTINGAHAMNLAGLVLAWCACRSAPMDAVLRDLHSTSVPVAMALEALVVGALCLVGLVVIGKIDRTKPLDASEAHATHVLPEGGVRALLSASMVGSCVAGLVVGGVVASLVAFEPLKGQTIFAAIVGGVGAGAAVNLVAASRAGAHTKLPVAGVPTAAVLSMMLAGVVAPLVALVWPGGGTLVEQAYSGTLSGPGALIGFDWAAGAFLGVPVGVSWSSSMMHEKH